MYSTAGSSVLCKNWMCWKWGPNYSICELVITSFRLCNGYSGEDPSTHWVISRVKASATQSAVLRLTQAASAFSVGISICFKKSPISVESLRILSDQEVKAELKKNSSSRVFTCGKMKWNNFIVDLIHLKKKTRSEIFQRGDEKWGGQNFPWQS